MKKNCDLYQIKGIKLNHPTLQGEFCICTCFSEARQPKIAPYNNYSTFTSPFSIISS